MRMQSSASEGRTAKAENSSAGWRHRGAKEQREGMSRRGARHGRKPRGSKKRRPRPKKCQRTPTWVGLPNGHTVRLADANGLHCGKKETRHDRTLVVLCDECRVRLGYKW